MDKGDRTIYVILFVFALFVLAGFYFTLDKIGGLKTDLKNLELQIQLSAEKDGTSGTTINPPLISQNPPPTPNSPQTNQDIIIPTAIIFDAQSSPILQPQTKITITIENLTKTKDGGIILNIKAFTNDANSYSALEPRDLFELVNLEGENQRAIQVTGQFNSIPPKNSTSGALIFKIEATSDRIILQVGSGENLKFYEFNFSRKTYKETVIG